MANQTKRKTTKRPSKAIPVKLNYTHYANVIVALEQQESRLKESISSVKKYPNIRRMVQKQLDGVQATKNTIERQAQMNWNLNHGYGKRAFLSPKKR